MLAVLNLVTSPNVDSASELVASSPTNLVIPFGHIPRQNETYTAKKPSLKQTSLGFNAAVLSKYRNEYSAV